MDKVQIRADERDDALVLHLNGDAGVEQADELDRQLRACLLIKRALIVLECSGLTFLSSVSLGVLLRFRKEIIDAGGKLALAALKPIVHESLRRAGLHQIFALYDDVESAIKSAANP